MTLKVRILPFLTTFAQLSERLKNFLGGWLLVLGIKEGLVECATVCVQSVVILKILSSWNFIEKYFLLHLTLSSFLDKVVPRWGGTSTYNLQSLDAAPRWQKMCESRARPLFEIAVATKTWKLRTFDQVGHCSARRFLRVRKVHVILFVTHDAFEIRINLLRIVTEDPLMISVMFV